MYIRNYEEVVEQLEVKLKDYLEEHGIDTRGNFKCLNPDHEDRNPSCGVNGNGGKTFHCFSCKDAGNIFKAAHYLEGKPLAGKEYILFNVAYLAEKYGIKVDMTELSEAELYEIDTYRAYRLTSEYITKSPRDSIVQEAINYRGWDNELCVKMGIGTVDSFRGLREYLRRAGFETNFLDEIDIARKKGVVQLFSDKNLIFTIKDERGRPVGFASRNLEYTKDNTNGSKYVNQATTGLKCNIYKKGQRLYNLDSLIAQGVNRPREVWIMEGYTDVITSCQNGLTNCVAIGGTSFTKDHLHLLKENGFHDLVLCLDGDSAGRSRMAELLDKVFGGHKDVNLKIVICPEDHDPDSFIRSKGIDAFLELEKWSAFEWRLQQFDGDEDDEMVCAGMIPLIVNEPNYIKQGKMIETLGRQTGIPVSSIQQEVKRLQNERENKKLLEREDIINKLVYKAQRTPSDIDLILAEAQGALYDLSRKYNTDSLSEESYVTKLLKIKKEQEEKGDDFSGWHLGPDLEILALELNGNWKESAFCMIGGKANSGKTSFLVKTAFEVASSPENDAVVIYHSIDDTIDQISPKFVCVANGSKKLEINQTISPNFYIKEGLDVQDHRETGYHILQELGKNGRLVVKDANDGQSLAYVENLVRYYREKYPKRNIMYILDNFHKLKDLASTDANSQAYKTMSQRMKALVGKYQICAFCTVEYHKLESGVRPTNNNIGECLTGDTLIYDPELEIYRRIDECKVGQAVLTLGENKRAIPSHITAVLDKGLQEIYKVKTRSGREVRTTMGHPFYSENGWTQLQHLRVGSLIGCPRVEGYNTDRDILPPSYSEKFGSTKPLERGEAQFLADMYVGKEREELFDLAYNSIYWDKIISIEKEGLLQAWDLTVENTHNFVANDIFCHNTVQLEYDANLVIHLYSDLHDRGDRSEMFHTRIKEGKLIKEPIIEIIVGKNKITSFKGKLYAKFFPSTSEWIIEEQNVLAQEAEERAKEPEVPNIFD